MLLSIQRVASSAFRESRGTRIRAPWRILASFAVFFAALIALQAAAGALGLSALAERVVTALIFFAASAAALLVASRLDRRPVRAYGLDLDRRWWTDFVAAAVLGVLLHGAKAAAHLGLGWVSVAEVGSPGLGAPMATGLLATLVFFLGVAVWEEVLFRGVLIRNAIEGIADLGGSPRGSVTAGWVLSAIVFGALHYFASLGHEGISPTVVVLSSAVSGAYFALAYVLTGRLAFPIGLHLGTNFADSAIFGGTAGPYEGYPAVVRLADEFPGGWEAWGGLGFVFAVATVLLVLAWIRLTRGALSYDTSLLAETDAGRRAGG